MNEGEAERLFDILAKVAERLAAERDLPSLVASIEEQLCAYLSVEYSVYYFLDFESGALRILHSRGFDERERQVAEATAMERHPGWVVRNRRPLDVPDTSDDAISVDSPRSFEVRSRLYYPVLFRDRAFGAVGLASARPRFFTDTHRKLLGFVCHVAGIAYQNMLYARQLEARTAERYRRLIESTSDGVVWLDRDLRLVDSNRTVSEWLGRESDDLKGRSLVDLVAERHRAAAAASLESATRTFHAERVEVVLEAQQRLDVELTLLPLSHDGNFDGGFAVLRDVGERRRAQAQLAQADRLAAVGLLAAGVGHEINNPLHYVLSNLQMVREHVATPSAAGCRLDPSERVELQGMLDDALDGTRRIQAIVRALRTFSRVDATAPGPVDVNAVLEGVISMAQSELKYRATVVRSLGEVPAVLADAGQLSQVFLNLLVNAAQSIEEGEIERNSVTVTSRRRGGTVEVEVADTGCGIPAENVPRLFDPFFTTKPLGRGSGLGLSISRNIVHGLGGTIEVESEVGRGTRVRVGLPAATADLEAERGEASPSPPPTRVPAGRILVVDDEALICGSVRRALSPSHEVVVARSGAEAREVLSKDPGFDVVLCDLLMADGSGMELSDWLGERVPSLARRIVFMTGGAFTERSREFFDALTTPKLEKPFSLDELRRVVQQVIDDAERASPR